VKLLERHPFSGRCDSAGELLHTPYADSNFCGHGPDVYTTRNTLSLIGRLEQICFGPAYLENVRLNPSSPELLTSYGPLRIFDTRKYDFSFFFLRKKKICIRPSIFFYFFIFYVRFVVRTDLKFERRPRSLK